MSQENNFIPSQDGYKKLTPFQLFVKSNFPFIENTYESLDNYGLYCKVVEYLNDVIANENTVESNVQALYNAFVSLNTYVSNYFDNLDVQEEINNKLDEMVESGVMSDLIGYYVDNEIQPQIDSQNYHLSNMQTQLNRTENKVNSAASGSPAGVYATLSDLQTDNPDHSKIYVVTATGKWYFWNTNAWAEGGTYQATDIADNSITMSKLSYYFKTDSDNKLDTDNVLLDKVWAINQPVTSNNTSTNSNYKSYPAIPVTPEQQLILLDKLGNVYTRSVDQVIYFNEDGSYNSYASIAAGGQPFEIPEGIYYIKITILKTRDIAQLKDYDSGDYNPNYEPYKYVPKIVFKDDIKDLDDFNTITVEYTDDAYINTNQQSSKIGQAMTDQYSSDYSVTNYIKVYPGDKIKFENIVAAQSTGICAYNKEKEYVAVVLGQSSDIEYEYTVPNGVEYVRATILTAKKDLVSIYYTKITYENILKLNNTIENMQDKINLNFNNICETYANTPTLTWVDDDCVERGITQVKSICDLTGIKATFGCITENLNPTLISLLKSYQDEGFQITSHTATHDRWYKSTSDGNIFTNEQCESDLIKSLVTLNLEGFLDNDYIIAPGGSVSRVGIDTIIDKWAKCFVGNTKDKSYNNLYTPFKYNLNRTMIDKTLHDLDFYKDWIDTAIANKSWIILGSHSYNTSEFDAELVQQIIEYAQSQGVQIKTLNQAFKDRHIIYDLKSLFS